MKIFCTILHITLIYYKSIKMITTYLFGSIFNYVANYIFKKIQIVPLLFNISNKFTFHHLNLQASGKYILIISLSQHSPKEDGLARKSLMYSPENLGRIRPQNMKGAFELVP